MSFRDSDLRRMGVTGLTDGKKLFFYDSSDATATSSARDYFNSVVSEMESGDIMTLKNDDDVKSFEVTVDRGAVSLTEIT